MAFSLCKVSQTFLKQVDILAQAVAKMLAQTSLLPVKTCALGMRCTCANNTRVCP